MADILLTVSGNIPADVREQVRSGKRPRPDYIALADGLPADLLDYSAVRAEGGWFTRLLGRLGGPNAALAWECFRRRGQYEVIFSDGEQVGIPLAVFLKFLGRGPRRTRHAMIVHILSVQPKMAFFDFLGIQSAIDRFLVYATWQKNFIQARWKVPAEKVPWIPFQADGGFFRPAQAPAPDAPALICSAGLEFRDYPTMLAAVDGLDVQVVLAAASPWSTRSDTTANRAIPANVTVRRFSLFEMRELYARANFVVVPLFQVNFQAGVTTILEAMAMGKAVIVTRTPGQTDYIQEGVSGAYVPPGDPAALRAAIQYYLEHPAEADRLGQAGRTIFEKDFDLDVYVEKIKGILSTILSGRVL